MLVERGRRYWRRPLMAVIVAGAWFSMALPAYAILATGISACRSINKPGVYELTQDVTATKGGDCIRITVPGVTLYLNGYNLSGVSSATPPVGTGIHVLASAPGTIVIDPSNAITDFATGIENDAANAVFYGVTVRSSGGNGVVNNGASANFIGVTSGLNGKNGFVNQARNVLFLACVAQGDGANGIVLKSPPAPAPPATHVHLFVFFSVGNLKNGILLRRASADHLATIVAEGNNDDGLLITGGGGNWLVFASASYLNKGYGVEIKSSNGNLIDSLTVAQNLKGGVHIARSNNNAMNELQALSNVGAGVWLHSASGNTIGFGNICGNTTSGVYIGCSASTLPSNTSCGTAPHSNRNLATGNYPQSNAVGIGIDKGNHHNRVLLNDSVDAQTTPCNGANSTYDLEDDNKNCDSNMWDFNTYTQASLPCIQ